MGREAKQPVALPLTSSGGYVRNPSFSLDGSEVVFAWTGPRAGKFNLYVKLIGANDLLRLTNSSTDESSPAWSPTANALRLSVASERENTPS